MRATFRIRCVCVPPWYRRKVGLSTFNSDLLAFFPSDAVLRQHILQGHNAFQVMHVGAAYEVQKNFPMTVLSEIRPPRAYRAAFVCGTPLPRASGKKR